ncbi:hypothetical protein A3C20_04790 [Candidatus Kaiserbacteria bacterium RIFCSPHIGHO2_02_FULL_55_25]|uniref:Uncharacterized protein n=1 Tax=Candidatus Kaiserbacteria bacterium RIFCSPHIGHO2_02_FULL_55_25 TaxID=1798498 RepID=A0A1F6EB19_9BACT|nr:MAG: hypothetical protein A2764_02175 [Candidatus Kaiserbacteria bacterium RIFCSPHIGHO2_01_FULL_55_79]OGG70807.1 MAG: hypothetical protein A3C20_04790 [Candidatus Kaiserbacteria bacterium RIFCSPHIGHO2_02_FULL_55_25]OGG77146.1 MAG: hypothetical protein A3F56_04750 [Candidatus Kaiserbacteria bacterium RIFCSPHIGHO2_12_FULL_55_13]OGG83400.1 MAG: hypothetical protein A3A42_04275 [Candidatus Kaiserbacteria bacterium RIFCSPLOWO2_01_FULL_55_25]
MRQNPENRRAVNEGLNDHRDEKEEARRMQKAIEGFSYRDMLNENAARFMSSAAEMSESRESFPFPGIELEVHTKMIATDREFPGYTTPVDTLLDRCRGEGIRVMLGKNPESGNVYIVPAGRNEPDNEDMFILPRHLQINEMMDGDLRVLVIRDRLRYQSVRR